LRRLLGGRDAISWRDPGYVLRAFPDVTDLAMVQRLVGQARGEPPARAVELLSAALGLWQGNSLDDLNGSDYFAGEAARLDELRRATRVTLIAARLRLGEHADLIPELEELVRGDPYREELHALLMHALYRDGRQCAALGRYEEVRR